jgi:hypothetical protein
VFILPSGGSPKQLGQLPVQNDWTIYHANPTIEQGFIAAGIVKGEPNRWSIVRCNIQESRRSESEESDQTLRTDMISLPNLLKVKDIVLLGSEQILILDEAGNLHYWQPARSNPRKLSHAKWKRDAQCVIRAGSKGWIAVVAKGHLSMWRIGYGGVLHPYDRLPNEFDVGAINATTLHATSDGRYLMALPLAKDKMIFAWEFPRYAADEL